MIKKLLTVITIFILPLFCIADRSDAVADISDNTKYVNPLVGTDFHGHTFPGATYPFGMVQLSPDTREDNWDGCSGYHYSDSTIWGFSHTHLSGTGCADYCDLLIMPVVSYEESIKVAENKYRLDNFPQDYLTHEYYSSEFKHSNETASPGYYSVLLERWGVNAELTAGKRIGVHRYTYNKSGHPELVIDLDHRDQVLESSIQIESDKVITGHRKSRSWATEQDLYFYIEFSKKITKASIIKGSEESGSKALLRFSPGFLTKIGLKPNELIVKVGISSVSVENAKQNMISETENRSLKGQFKNDFDRIREETREAWREYLAKIDVTSDNEEDKKVFYTALYHTAVSPNLYSDVNGEYRGMDRKVHKADYDHYTVFSLWDTFRALHPLFSIIERERTVDFINSFLSIYDQAGKLPIWELAGNETNCMIGYHSIPVIADALAKGIDGFDLDHALEAMVASSNKEEFGITVYRDNGLVLAEKEHESVSKTLEYGVDDWCIAQVAKRLQKDSLYTAYMKRAQFYKNLYDPSTQFMRPRINGLWIEPFLPSEVNVHFTEANSWQYTFHVPQDVSGLIDLFGGEAQFDKRMDDLFSADSQLQGWNSADMTGMIGQYVQGNEPSHHIAYLYPYIGKAYKSQKVVRQIMSTLFTSAPDGLCGNEDCGQMSAWYVLSSMGFYPVIPGSDEYVLGSPVFKKVVINLENGKHFTIEAPNNSPENIYIKGVKRNGADYSNAFFRHNDIMNGASFEFDMASDPNHAFGSNPENRPHSSIEEQLKINAPSEALIVVNPWFEAPNSVFKESIEVAIGKLRPEYKIMYKIEREGDGAVSEYKEYTKPFKLFGTARVSAYCEDDYGNKSFVTNSQFNQIHSTYKVKIAKKYSRQYSAGGDDGLIDLIRGNVNFRLGGWQGYQNKDFEAVIDMGEVKHVNEIGAGFLQDVKSWIWMPKYVEFYTSVDGKYYSFQGRLGHSIDDKDYTPQTKDLMLKIVPSDGSDNIGVDARYVKVIAKNYGDIPKWHLGAGGKAYIFVDEVIIR